MKKEVYKKKIIEKLGFNCVEETTDGEILVGTNFSDPKTKRERTEGQHKKKACCCGAHSIAGYKEKWKFPRWKKLRKYDK